MLAKRMLREIVKYNARLKHKLFKSFWHSGKYMLCSLYLVWCSILSSYKQKFLILFSQFQLNTL